MGEANEVLRTSPLLTNRLPYVQTFPAPLLMYTDRNSEYTPRSFFQRSTSDPHARALLFRASLLPAPPDSLVRIGLLIMLCHDVSDVFLESAKLFNYAQKRFHWCHVSESLVPVLGRGRDGRTEGRNKWRK